MEQTWRDLLFAHWSYPIDEIRAVVPDSLPLDTFDGQAWIGVVPFMLEGFKARGLVPLPGMAAFPELNVRTYVTVGGKPGVYFFSLDADSKLAVLGARMIHLNYFDAEMSLAQTPKGIAFQSTRSDLRGPPASFSALYSPVGETFEPQRGTLEHFLTERYCLYSVDAAGAVGRLEIHHRPWLLQRAQADLDAGSVVQAAGLATPFRQPLLHFASVQPMIGWAPEHIG